MFRRMLIHFDTNHWVEDFYSQLEILFHRYISSGVSGSRSGFLFSITGILYKASKWCYFIFNYMHTFNVAPSKVQPLDRKYVHDRGESNEWTGEKTYASFSLIPKIVYFSIKGGKKATRNTIGNAK